MQWLILFIIILAVVGLIIWLSRRPTRSARPKIHGKTCPQCQSTDIHWAGYSDRKECAKCGKIFG